MKTLSKYINCIFVLSLCLFLGGCMWQNKPTYIVDRQMVVVMPSKALFDCPQLKKLPKSVDLTDLQVAQLLKRLYTNNVRCKKSLDSIYKFLVKSKKTVEGKSIYN